AKLTIDGKEAKVEGKRLRLHPGKHRLVATLDGHTTVERELEVTRAEGQKVSFLLVPALAGPPPPVAPGIAAAFAGNDLVALRRMLADPKAERVSKSRALQALADKGDGLAKELT